MVISVRLKKKFNKITNVLVGMIDSASNILLGIQHVHKKVKQFFFCCKYIYIDRIFDIIKKLTYINNTGIYGYVILSLQNFIS